MTPLDRAINAIAPAHGVKRIKARAAIAAAEATGYVAGSRRRGSSSMWRPLTASADADTLPDLEDLYARSRDLVRNDPLAQSAISTKVVNVIGAGHVLRPEVDHERLGISADQAEEWEELALDIWTDWAQGTDCDVTRAQSFAGLEDLAYRSRLLSGDVFRIRRFKPRKGRLLATCYQMVEADRVSNPHWRVDSDTIAGGVEVDADGAALRIHVASRHQIDRRIAGTTWQQIPIYDAQGRRQVVHIHGVRWRPDLTRYAPMLAPVIEALKQRSRYSEAELMAAVISACFAIGMKSPDGDLGEGLSTGAAQPGGASETGNPIEVTGPGQIFNLMENEQIMSFAPGRPNPQFSPFIEAIAQEVGAGTDLPYELLMKKFQASYSASKAALEMAWQFFRAERALHVEQFCQTAYEDVITEAVARGLLQAPGFFHDPLRRRAWLGAEWMGPARITIDPVKDATADEKYLEMGADTLTRITAARFGVDARKVQRRRARDGSNDVVGNRAASAPAAAPEPDDDDDETDNDEETS